MLQCRNLLELKSKRADGETQRALVAAPQRREPAGRRLSKVGLALGGGPGGVQGSLQRLATRGRSPIVDRGEMLPRHLVSKREGPEAGSSDRPGSDPEERCPRRDPPDGRTSGQHILKLLPFWVGHRPLAKRTCRIWDASLIRRQDNYCVLGVPKSGRKEKGSQWPTQPWVSGSDVGILRGTGA